MKFVNGLVFNEANILYKLAHLCIEGMCSLYILLKFLFDDVKGNYILIKSNHFYLQFHIYFDREDHLAECDAVADIS